MMKKHRLDFIIIGSIVLFAFICVLVIKLTQKEGKYVVIIYNPVSYTHLTLPTKLEV